VAGAGERIEICEYAPTAEECEGEV